MTFLRKRDLLIQALFLAGLFAAYLYALFGVAHLSDVGNAGHDVARVLAAGLELLVVGLVMTWLLRRWRESRRVGWYVTCMVLAAVVLCVYLAQIYSLYLSNNFVSVLGMQNLDSLRFTQSSREGVIFAAGAVWLVGLGVCAWFLPARRRAGGHGLLLWFAVAGLLYVWLFTLQRHHVRLEPDFRQVPLASMAVNAGLSLRGEHEVVPTAPASSASVRAHAACFQDPDAGKVVGYPFQKTRVYRQHLPFARKSGATMHPNVIVIFTEGLSARVLGAYGGAYPGLTPHIDQLAHRSLKVVDYYNHTAATYRGLIGQNTSGFAFNGGGGAHGWAGGDHTARLTAIRRASLADILEARGYDTAFFEPHSVRSPFGHMLHSLGFSRVYGIQGVSKLLGGRDVRDPMLHEVNDATLFDGLSAWLRQRHEEGSNKPFYAALYNIGTHAFISMVPGGKAYAPHPNRYLDKVHTYDAALGQFLDYFLASPYARNTILVFTTDHATYPDKVYRDIAGKDLKPYFVDRIPLLIHDPTHRLPATLDAHARNSLDLAPTLLQLLGIRETPNSFLGASLFESRHFTVGLSALGNDYYVTLPDGVHPIWAVKGKVRKTAECERAVVARYYRMEASNRLFTSTPRVAAKAGTVATPAVSVSAFAPHRAPAPGHVLCALDTLDGRRIKHDGHDVRMPSGQAFTAKGWLVDARHRAVSDIDLLLQPLAGGRAHRFAAKTGLQRPDVVQAIESEQALASGFRVRGGAENLSSGRYRVLANAKADDADFSCDFHVTVRVPDAGKP